MRVTVLGCGSSGGVPLIGCDCKICRSDNPKNNRTRSSLFIEINDLKLLVDTSPDLRQQALRASMNRVDAVLFTHDHADHTHGIDDLRSFNFLANDTIPLYGDEHTMQSLQSRYGYAFQPKPERIWYRPSFTANSLKTAPSQQLRLKDTDIAIFEQQHERVTTLGLRIGGFAYSTDVNALPDSAFAALKGVDTWVVDCLRYRKSPAHANVETALKWLDMVKPKRAILTHMSHELDYDTLRAELPANAEPAYDGMIIEL